MELLGLHLKTSGIFWGHSVVIPRLAAVMVQLQLVTDEQRWTRYESYDATTAFRGKGFIMLVSF